MEVVSTYSTQISLPYHVPRYTNSIITATAITNDTTNHFPTSSRGFLFFLYIALLFAPFHFSSRQNHIFSSSFFALHEHFLILFRLGFLQLQRCLLSTSPSVPISDVHVSTCNQEFVRFAYRQRSHPVLVHIRSLRFQWSSHKRYKNRIKIENKNTIEIISASSTLTEQEDKTNPLRLVKSTREISTNLLLLKGKRKYSETHSSANLQPHRDITMDDDSSVATQTTCNDIVRPNLEVKEFTIRFRFNPKNEVGNNLVARSHYNLLHLIKTTFNPLRILGVLLRLRGY